jgi:hypothetical protein
MEGGVPCATGQASLRVHCRRQADTRPCESAPGGQVGSGRYQPLQRAADSGLGRQPFTVNLKNGRPSFRYLSGAGRAADKTGRSFCKPRVKRFPARPAIPGNPDPARSQPPIPQNRRRIDLSCRVNRTLWRPLVKVAARIRMRTFFLARRQATL